MLVRRFLSSIGSTGVRGFTTTVPALARPKGPNCTRNEAREDAANRPEFTMAKMAARPAEDMDLRRMYERPMPNHPLRAIPRDYGALPRNYALRLLYFSQPCKLADLWTLAKQNEDCPFDSRRHLKQVLEVASMQNWVRREKNQSDRMWYYSVHNSHAQAVEELLMAKKRAVDAAAERARDEAAEQQRADHERKAAALDEAIHQLQQQLVKNVVKLQERDPAAASRLSYVTKSGAINFSAAN